MTEPRVVGRRGGYVEQEAIEPKGPQTEFALIRKSLVHHMLRVLGYRIPRGRRRSQDLR